VSQSGVALEEFLEGFMAIPSTRVYLLSLVSLVLLPLFLTLFCVLTVKLGEAPRLYSGLRRFGGPTRIIIIRPPPPNRRKDERLVADAFPTRDAVVFIVMWIWVVGVWCWYGGIS
jgi:hypothetical protein